MIECPMCQSTQVKVEWDVVKKLSCHILESYLICLNCRKCAITITSQIIDNYSIEHWIDEKDR